MLNQQEASARARLAAARRGCAQYLAQMESLVRSEVEEVAAQCERLETEASWGDGGGCGNTHARLRASVIDPHSPTNPIRAGARAQAAAAGGTAVPDPSTARRARGPPAGPARPDPGAGAALGGVHEPALRASSRAAGAAAGGAGAPGNRGARQAGADGLPRTGKRGARAGVTSLVHTLVRKTVHTCFAEMS